MSKARNSMGWRARSTLFALALAVCLAGLGVGRAAAAGGTGLFGATETRGDNLLMFGKWDGVLARMRETPEPFDDSCEGPGARCHLKEWNAFLLSIKDKDKMAQLEAVNDYMNKFPYIEDVVNWGKEDYWETPLEFLQFSGDCKDYAIAKYMSLRFLGWPIDELRLVVVQDLNLHLGHAILVAYIDGKTIALDNQIKHLINTQNIHHYRPVYAVNESHWWLFRS
ncbi:MAG TPA: transglutaminase-like cysteine peptidase [Alphaproteobacteria bacterium]|nr:transglutaminase-like cysteine peptidase [Alphaproteobacteria bacterium]